MIKPKVDSLELPSAWKHLLFSSIDLKILFELISRVDKADEPIQKDLEAYAYQVGMEEMNTKKEATSEVNPIPSSDRFPLSLSAMQDPEVYVETILEVYQRFSTIVSHGFCNHHSYKVALDKVRRSVASS